VHGQLSAGLGRPWPAPRRPHGAIEPRPVVSRAQELETAKEILAEVFHARPGEVEEMIQRRLEESGPEEPQRVMHECERQKYFMRPIVHTKID